MALKDGKVVKEGPTDEIIRPAVLKDIYDMDINIQHIDNNKICVFYA